MSAIVNKPRILVVEDEAIVARDLQMQLRELGYEPVGHATQGEQAITLAGQLLPDLVLMDIRLAGGMDGIAAAQAIRRQFSLPVVFLSAFAEDDTLARAKRAEPFGYILKPFSERDLRTVLEMALYKHKADATVRISDAALKAVSQGVIISDASQLIISANDAFVSLTGYEESEILGRNCRFLQGPLTDERTVETIRLALANGTEFSGEILNYRKDGSTFWNELSISPVHNEQDRLTHFIGITRDVSTRVSADTVQLAWLKLSEAAHSAPDLPSLFPRIHTIISELLPAKNFYVALYDESSDMVRFPYFVDEFDAAPEPHKLNEGRGLTDLVLRSGEPLLLSPHSMQGLLTHSRLDIIGTDGIDWLGIPLKTAGMTIGVLTVQNYSGSVRYTENDKELLQFVSEQVATAIERMQAQQAVTDSEERFHSVFDQSPIIICLLSYPDGQFLEMNAAGVEAFGFPRDELVGRTSAELSSWEDLDERDRYLKLLHMSGSVKNFEARMRRRDGSIFTVLYSGSVVTLGERLFSLDSLQDITERKLAERWQRHYADTLGLIALETKTVAILESMTRFVEQQADGVLCSILQLSSDGKRLLFGAGPSLPDFYNMAIHNSEIGPGFGSCGAAAFSGKAVIVEDVMTHPNWIPWRDLAAKADLRACWSHPILSSDNKVLGTFAIYRREPSLPSAAELDLIRQSAGLAAIALERAQLHEDRRLAKVVFEQSVEGIMVTDTEHRVLMVNESFELLTGYSSAEVVGHPQNILDAGQFDPSLHEAMDEGIASSGHWRGELWGKRKSDEIYPLSMSVATVRDASGSPSHFINIITDISAQKIQAARIEQLAFYDSLTALPNRALFLDRLEQTLAASQRHGGRGAILFLDLDRFKEINDSLGHAVGDLALAEVARRLLKAVRNEETLARMGGDEFVLIAENADHKAAVRIAARMQNALVPPLDLMGQSYSVGASIGIAFYPEDGHTSEDLLKRTDIAMYRAKASGGGYRLYQAEMGEALDKRLNVAQRLAHAMETDGLLLYFQPQIDLDSGRVVGAEVLLRWNDPALGWIGPAEFVPIAEERGMMGALGDWVLRQACRQVNAWAQSGVALNGRLAINVSALQMEDPDIVGRLIEIVHEANLTPDRFELELTESSMMNNPERAVEVMNLLRSAGFRLSIDDFGTGYSSLAYLKRFSADQIKIDICFVRNMLTDTDDNAIVTTIIAMARSLGLETTAEGVEEAGQAEALRLLGCNSAQGYHFGRPEPAQVFMERWLKAPVKV